MFAVRILHYLLGKKCKVMVILKNASGSIVGKDKSDTFFTISPYSYCKNLKGGGRCSLC
jgi:hypothetical protein